MAKILKSEIRYAKLNPARGNEPLGLRHVLVLSHDVCNERSETIFASPIYQNIRGLKSDKSEPSLLRGLWKKYSYYETKLILNKMRREL